MTRDDLHGLLRAAADSPAPGADPAFAAALEQRLRAVHHGLPDRLPGATEPRPDAASPAPARPWFRSPLARATAVAVMAMLSLPLLLRGPSPSGVELVAAFDTHVTLPDGRTVAGRPGLVLQEGAVVLTGPRGSAEADGVRLGSGEVAVVQGGELHRVERTRRQPAPQPSAAERPPRSPAPGIVTLPALPGQSPRPAPPADGASDDGPSAPRPTADGKPSDDAAADRAAHDVHGEQPQTGKAEPDGAHAIGLATWSDRRIVQVGWTEFGHPGFAFFAVLRAPYPAVPHWPLRDGTEVIGYSRDPDQRQFTDDDVEYRPVYRVVALDRSGNELGRSGAVTPSFEQTPSRPEARRAGPITYGD
jgi:hypothetical protein